MIVVLLGPPGAGKGTQGDLIAEQLGIPKIATGDVLRAAVREGTPLGLAAKAAMNKGDLVPDDVILGIIKQTLASPSTRRGAILDELGKKLDAVMIFEVPDDELVRRLGARTVCESCQTPYTGRKPGSKCDKCGGKLVRRKDDEPKAVRNRLKVYKQQTAPVIDWYRANGGRVLSIDAVGTTAEVLARALGALRS